MFFIESVCIECCICIKRVSPYYSCEFLIIMTKAYLFMEIYISFAFDGMFNVLIKCSPYFGLLEYLPKIVFLPLYAGNSMLFITFVIL